MSRHMAGLMVAVGLWLWAAPVQAVDDRLAFLHALEDRGYGELAVDFLNRLKKDDKSLDADLRKQYEIELATSLRISAQEAGDRAEVVQRLTSALAHVDEYLKQGPEGMLAAKAQATGGDVELDLAQVMTPVPGQTRSKDGASAASAGDARAALERARGYFVRAVELYQAIASKATEETSAVQPKGRVPHPKPPAAAPEPVASKEGDEARECALECVFKLSSIDYRLAQTFAKRDDPQRTKALQNAAKGFDEVFQQYRTYRIGLFAHLWYGKTLVELGDKEKAVDVYDEVLASAPEEGQPRPDRALEEVYAEAEYQRLLLLASRDQPAEPPGSNAQGKQKEGLRVVVSTKTESLPQVAKEAEKWLEANGAASFTSGYQGVRLEQAKALITLAERGKDQKALPTALAALAEVARTPGPHQAEAVQLRRRYAAQAGKVVLRDFDEALSLADTSASAALWDEAIPAYQRAIELSKTDASGEKTVLATYRLARAYFQSGKPDTALELAEALVREHSAHALAPAAATLAIRAALAVALSAKDKAAAEQRLAKLVDFVGQRWPDRPETDEARMILGEAALGRRDYAAALKVFEAFKPESSRYGLARLLLAQAHWQIYLDEKRKPAGAQDEALMQSERASAVAIINASLAQPARESDSQKATDITAQHRLLLAEMQYEAGQIDPSRETLRPLVDNVDERATMSAATAVRVLRHALRLDLEKKDFSAAGETAFRLVDQEWHRVQSAAPPNENGATAAASDSAWNRIVQINGLLKKLIEQLKSRANFTLPGLLVLADACQDVGQNEQARAYFQEIVERADKDPAVKETGAEAVAQARVQLVGFLRSEKKYEEALQEAERLVADRPQAIEPLLEKGRILQAWGETEPNRYEQALGVWTPLRMAMQRMPQKPPVFYEVVYNAAYCLVQKGARSNDRSGLAEARQLLKSTMIFNPQLSGPDMVAKYKTLLDKCRFLEEHKMR